MTLKNQKNNTKLLCNGEMLTLKTLINRFKKQGITNQEKEANRLINLLKNNNAIEFYDIYP